MSELKDRVREIVALIYQGIDVNENYNKLCRMMIPVIRQRSNIFVKRMIDYDFEDFFQEACITIWNITMVKKPVIEKSALGYLDHAIWYQFINLFDRYITKNGYRKYDKEDRNTGLTVFSVFVASWIERRRRKARERWKIKKERYLKEYIETHGHPPIKPVPLSAEEKKLRNKQNAYNYYWANRERLLFIGRERSRLQRKRIIYGKRLSARQIVTKSGKKKFMLVEGTAGPLPYSATMSNEEYLAYLNLKQPKKKTYKKKYYKARKKKILENNAKYYEKHREEILKQKAEYYQAHKVEIIKQKAEYRRTHKEEIRERAAKRYQAHREENIKRAKEYRQKHKEEIHKRDAERYQANKEAILKYHAEYYRAHREEILKKAKEYGQTHKEEIKARRKKLKLKKN